VTSATQDRTAWLQERRTGIGASECAAVVGLSPWATPLDIYLSKVATDVPAEGPDSEPMYWGRELEAVILRRYQRDTGRQLDTEQKLVRSPQHPFMIATPDARASDRLVEVKTAGLQAAKEWGEPGTDAVPMQYLLQVTHQMIVTGDQLADIAVLIAGNDYRVYQVKLDPELAAMLIEREAAFWRAVEAREPPDPTSLAAASLRWPVDTGKTMTATPEIYAAWTQLRSLREELKAREADCDALELAIKTCMADAATLVGPAGETLCTWKTQSARRLDSKALRAAHPAIYEAFLTESPSRVFRMKEPKK